MKLVNAFLIAAAVVGVGAFAPSYSRPAFLSSTSSSTASSTAIFVGWVGGNSLGFDQSGMRLSEEEQKDFDKSKKIMEWIGVPDALKQRSNMGDAVIVSGFDPTDSSGKLVLGFLNNEESPQLTFKKIVAHVPDLKLAKKRLISRDARYTGLLDKLDIVEADESSPTLPTSAQLDGISSWVAHIPAVEGDDDLATRLGALASLAEDAESVKNLSILVSGSQSLESGALAEIEESLKSKMTTVAYTLMAIGEWNDDPEASCAYRFSNVTDVADGTETMLTADASFSRAESLRMVTEFLAIDSAAGLSIVARAEKNATSLDGMVIRGLRDIGFPRPQEVARMLNNGTQAYSQHLVNVEKKVEENLLRAKEQKKEYEATKEKADEVKRKELEALLANGKYYKINKKQLEDRAKEWAKKEYTKKSLTTHTFAQLEDFTESVWDRAMFEVELHYRLEIGMEVDVDAERLAFAEKKEKEKAESVKKLKELFENVSLDDIKMPTSMMKNIED